MNFKIFSLVVAAHLIFITLSCQISNENFNPRQRTAINQGWRFFKYNATHEADSLMYDVRPDVTDSRDNNPADARPTEAVETETIRNVLKPWILPTGNDFINDPDKRYIRPEGSPGSHFSFVQNGFDDSRWEMVTLPHDWAIGGPFMTETEAEVGGGMGRLPGPGVAWYRKKLDIPSSDVEKRFFLEVEGAMSYAMVWLNGHLAGGWPYGYATWQVDLTPFIIPGDENQLAIRLDNPPHSSRWYPGGGLYRNVWLVKTHPIHVSQWGTFITTRKIKKDAAIVDLEISIKNESQKAVEVDVLTDIYKVDAEGNTQGLAIASAATSKVLIEAGTKATIVDSLTIKNPVLWGPPPTQVPELYTAITTLEVQGELVDQYETNFGIRKLIFDPEAGLLVNDEPVYLKGVNQHHDLGALGAAFNRRAAERQLEMLREMGCNAIRMAHNPPAPELLDLTDRMGFLVVNEIFDVWERKKTPLDFHLIFPDWHEQDVRAFIRRDRNHPSVIMWSLGNEVGEQYTGEEGAALADKLNKIAKEEDNTRPTTVSVNYAKPDMPFPAVMDVINLNYQGEGIRNAPAYSHLQGIRTPPLYPAFHTAFPQKLIISSENAAAVSSRGEFFFPVTAGISAPASDTTGGNPESRQVSGYELYTAPFGSSADKVFGSLEKHPFVSGGFAWSGWDYLGEPTPYYLSRSSYYGIIDLAGFKKERFYLYQAHWRSEFPMAHILPHWNWPERTGQITPVHVFTSGDEAELFLNGKSQGRKKKAAYEYRIRWDEVIYEPGELKVIAYKDGKTWAENIVSTTSKAVSLEAVADRNIIQSDGKDLSFVTVRVTDKDGMTVPRAKDLIRFSLEGPGEMLVTDNGDQTDMTPFPSHQRKAFNGLALVIIRSKSGDPGIIKISAESPDLKGTQVVVEVK